jgi:hypothetical protein
MMNGKNTGQKADIGLAAAGLASSSILLFFSIIIIGIIIIILPVAIIKALWIVCPGFCIFMLFLAGCWFILYKLFYKTLYQQYFVQYPNDRNSSAWQKADDEYKRRH